jgi:hypothetical protein
MGGKNSSLEPSTFRGSRGLMLAAPVDPHRAVKEAIKNLNGKEFAAWLKTNRAEFDAYQAEKAKGGS